MKKILFAIASVAMLFATSCKKDNNAPENIKLGEGEFLATIDNGANPQNAPRVSDGMSTKTHIDADNYVIWDDNDIIYINGESYKTKTGTTTAVFAPVEAAATGSAFHAFYAVENPSATAAEASLPATQTIEAGRVSNLPMYATCGSDRLLTFHNICAALKIVIPSFVNGATRIEVSSDKALHGTFTIGDNFAATVAAAQSDADRKLTVKKQNDVAFATDEVVYIAVPANSYESLKVEFFNGANSVWTKTVGTQAEPIVLAVNKIYNINATPMGLCFTALAQTNISMSSARSSSTAKDTFPAIHLEYCKYDCNTKTYSDWTLFIKPNTAASTVSLAAGDKLYLRAGDGTATIRTNTCLGYKGSTYVYYQFTSTDDVKVSGNIMYLLSKTPSTTLPQTQNGIFPYLFKGMNKLLDAKDLVLPAAILQDRCYYGMFMDCSNLMTAPTLPATTMAKYCYGDLFQNCTKLTTAPSLPATTLAESSYNGMFLGCSKLTTAPILRAATLEKNCYARMFNSCSALTEVTMLATTISTSNTACLSRWLYDAGTSASAGTTLTVNINPSITTLTTGIGSEIKSKTSSRWKIKNNNTTPGQSVDEYGNETN